MTEINSDRFVGLSDPRVVRIELTYANLCHSDDPQLTIRNWTEAFFMYPERIQISKVGLGA